MSWRDGYRPAAFRGAGFHVATSDTSHGRRQAVHEHAQRDTPYTEDLGRKAQEFSLDGYLLGTDYHLARDALIKACEQPGPGLLVHPYRGELSVVCRGLSVKESSAEGGCCTVSLTFLEAGEASFPRATTDSVNVIGSASDSLISAAKNSFVGKFLTAGFPAQVLAAAQDELAQVSDFMASPGFSFSSELGAASDMYYGARNMAASAFDLVQAPFKMATQMISTIGGVRSGFGLSSFGMLSSMFTSFVGSKPSRSYAASPTPITPSRQQIIANDFATSDLTRHVALAEAAKEAVGRLSIAQPLQVAPSVLGAPVLQPAALPLQPAVNPAFGPYPSQRDVLAVRAELTAAIDVELENPRTTDEVYSALVGLRAAIVKGIPLPGAKLPDLTAFTPRTTQSALLVAHNLYGDAGRADEISARNKPRHPGFLVGGSALEVLANG